MSTRIQVQIPMEALKEGERVERLFFFGKEL